MAKAKDASTQKQVLDANKRNYTTQSVMPKRKLRDAMMIPQAMLDHLGGRPAAPHQVAIAMGVSPTSSTWRDITGSASAYGLTEGGYNSGQMALTELGRRSVAPTTEGDDVKARCEAGLKPTVLRRFFERYDKAKFPGDVIAKNVLQHDLEVPHEKVDEVLEIIKDNAEYMGIVHSTKTGPFLALGNPQPEASIAGELDDAGTSNEPVVARPPLKLEVAKPSDSDAPTTAEQPAPFKVFISHGKNMDVVEQVKDVLGLYDIEFEVAIEEETTAIPVPDKVLSAMRQCQAGVMVLTADDVTKDGDEYPINDNVLIEIGAAFVLYNKRVVLLWDKRLKVPSNLQGLYRCEFEGKELSFSVGTRLAKAVKNFKSKGAGT